MDTNPDIERIEEYLQNRLSAPEREALEERLQEDKGLAAEFEKRKTAHSLLDYAVARSLKEQLQDLEQESKVISLRQRRRRIYTLSIAASVLILIGAFAIFMPRNDLSSTELAARYYSLPDLSGQRAAELTSPAQELMATGMDALERGQSDRAIESFAAVPDSSSLYLPARYYLGHAYHQAGQYAAADDIFAEVAATGDLRFAEDAEWYGLLSCLAREGTCLEQAQALAETSGHAHQEKAAEVWKALR